VEQLVDGRPLEGCPLAEELSHTQHITSPVYLMLMMASRAKCMKDLPSVLAPRDKIMCVRPVNGDAHCGRGLKWHRLSRRLDACELKAAPDAVVSW